MVATPIKRWSYPQRKRRANKSSSHSPMHISISLRKQTRWCPQTRFVLSPFLSSAKLPIMGPASLRRPRRQNSQKRKKWLIFPLHAAVIWDTGSIVASIATTFNAPNMITMTKDLTILIKMIKATITLIVKTRTTKTKSPTRRRMISSTITSRKKATRPCNRKVALAQDLLLALIPILIWAAAAGATPTIMCLIMTASQADPSSTITHTPRMMMTDVSITLTRVILFLPPSLLQWQKE